jgi:hypothetical protein
MRNPRQVTVRIDGKRWRRVLTLSASGSTDHDFVLETKPNGSTTVRFGDGIHGASPGKALKVDATFGTGAGAIRMGLRRSRTTGSPTRDQALWVSIRNRTLAIDFGG